MTNVQTAVVIHVESVSFEITDDDVAGLPPAPPEPTPVRFFVAVIALFAVPSVTVFFTWLRAYMHVELVDACPYSALPSLYAAVLTLVCIYGDARRTVLVATNLVGVGMLAWSIFFVYMFSGVGMPSAGFTLVGIVDACIVMTLIMVGVQVVRRT